MLLLILLTYHQKTTFCNDSFEKICPQKAFLKDHRNFLQWQCWENLLMKNIFEGTVTMTLRATFSIVRSITWAVIMIVLTEMSYHLLQFWWNSKIKEELLRIKTLHSQMKLSQNQCSSSKKTVTNKYNLRKLKKKPIRIYFFKSTFIFSNQNLFFRINI